MDYSQCVKVTPECPVSATTYGYTPNLGISVFFAVLFFLCALVQLVQGFRYKTYTWLIALFLGCLGEGVGYIGRIQQHSNVWDGNAFLMQLIPLIIAPSLMLGGIDLILKHVVTVFGPEYSPLRPALYTWIFICLDLFSLVLQAIGGAMASTGSQNNNYNTLHTGNQLIIAGIGVQVAQLAAFGLVSLAFLVRLVYIRRRRGGAPLSQEARSYLSRFSFRGFVVAATLAYFTILIRCIYRLPEMAGGWGGRLQREEVEFYILDTLMVAIAAVGLTVFHPGYCFPVMARGGHRSQAQRYHAQAQPQDFEGGMSENSHDAIALTKGKSQSWV